MNLSHALTGINPALVGRQAELALLSQTLEETLEGRGSVVLVAGEGGVGKTRLVAEVERESRGRGMLFLGSAGERQRAGLAYGSFTGVLRGFLQQGTYRERQLMQEMVAELAPQLRNTLISVPAKNGHSPSGGSPELRQRLFLARLASLLLERTRWQPVVICLEDLHWADSASLQLLLYLANKNPATPLTIIGTYCPSSALAGGVERRPADIEKAVLDLYRNDHFQLLNLPRLSAAETCELVDSCLGRVEFSEELRELIFRRTAGVPLSVVHYLETLRRRGVVYRRGSVAMCGRVEEDVPVSARAVLEQKVGLLPEEQRVLLGYAAIQGEVFEGTLIAEIMGWPRVKMLRELGRIEFGAHLVESGGKRFRFTHPLLAEVCYQSLPEAQRRAGHLHLADSLERRQPQDVESLAFHLYRAGEVFRVLPYLLEAGKRARAAFACREAKGFWEQALEIVEQRAGVDDGAQKVEILLALGEMEEHLGEWDLAIERCREVLRSTGEDRRISGRALLQLGALLSRKCAWEESEQAFRQALQCFGELEDRKAQVAALVKLGQIALERARLDEASVHFGSARHLVLQSGDQVALGAVSSSLGLVSERRGQYLKAVLHYTEALQAFRKAGHRYGICETYQRFGELHAVQQGWDDALECYAESVRQAREMGVVSLLARTLAGRAMAQLGAGDFEAAEGSCTAARTYMEQMQDRLGLAECDRIEGAIHRLQAQYAPAEELLQRGKHLFLDLENLLGVAECDRELGQVLQGRGDVEGARQHLRESSALFGRIGAIEEARKAEELLAALAA